MHSEMYKQMGLVGMDAIIANEWLILHKFGVLQLATCRLIRASRLAERPWHWQYLARTRQLPAATEVPLLVQLPTASRNRSDV